jgi:hypothetical protein
LSFKRVRDFFAGFLSVSPEFCRYNMWFQSISLPTRLVYHFTTDSRHWSISSRKKWVFLETKAEHDSNTRKKSKCSKYFIVQKDIEVSYKYTIWNRAFVNQKLHFSKIKSYYATKLSETSSDLLEFQKIEYDAGFALLGLLPYVSSCDILFFFSFFNALNFVKVEVRKEF